MLIEADELAANTDPDGRRRQAGVSRACDASEAQFNQGIAVREHQYQLVSCGGFI